MESLEHSRQPQRTIYDEAGRRWEVTERPASHIPGSRGSRCLVFDGGNTVRRLWSYPDDWVRMPDQGLLALCNAHLGEHRLEIPMARERDSRR